jgi:hypothetical protein
MEPHPPSHGWGLQYSVLILWSYQSLDSRHYHEEAEPDRTLDSGRDPREAVRLFLTKLRSRLGVARA